MGKRGGTTSEKKKTTLKPPYPLNPPFAYATIIQDEEGALLYEVLEPQLSEDELRAMSHLKELLLEELILPPDELRSMERPEQYLKEQVQERIRRYNIKLPFKDSLDKILYYIVRDFVGY
ncbi:MAG: hypothetical protein ACE5OY_05110, partial [Candidatus Bathyarchaeia archaeon]